MRAMEMRGTASLEGTASLAGTQEGVEDADVVMQVSQG